MWVLARFENKTTRPPAQQHDACFAAVFLDRLQECTDVSAKADVAAVIMQEGIAHLCLVTPNMTIVKQRIEVTALLCRKQIF